jgi:hypothetical protein
MHNSHQRQAQATIIARISTEDQGKGFSIPTRLKAGRRLTGREACTGRRL